MPFKVNVANQEITFTDKELFSFLLEKVHQETHIDVNLTDINSYIEVLFELVPKETLTQLNLTNISTLMFLSGYYFSNFLEKNIVEITQEEIKKE